VQGNNNIHKNYYLENEKIKKNNNNKDYNNFTNRKIICKGNIKKRRE
jgi:hypothetical protein